MSNEKKFDRKQHLESPLPWLVRLRDLLLGKRRPDIYTRMMFHINLIICITFLLWNLVGYISILSRKEIEDIKGVEIEKIIHERGVHLGFEAEDFADRLMVLYGIGVICWLIFFFGLTLLYRKHRQFVYFTLGPLLFYVGMHLFYMNFQFFAQDVTFTDKVLLLTVVTSIGFHAYFMRNERRGGSISFFGVAEDDA